MYTRQEASLVRKKFWASFGQYMRPVKGANGDSVNWLNYKTGIRHFYFRMDVGKESASIAIEISHPDPVVQQEYFERLFQLARILEDQTGETWKWESQALNEEEVMISRVSKELKNVSIFNENDWPAIISFLKPRIMALDQFWDLVKDGFAPS